VYWSFADLTALMVLFILGACFSDSAGPVNAPDNPDGNIMSRQTTEGIFNFSYGGGVTINKFKSAKLLDAWLL
jgi:hypothetical protein